MFDQQQQRRQETHWEVLETDPGPALALQRLQVREASPTRQRTAPHQTVTEDGALEELTEDQRKKS